MTACRASRASKVTGTPVDSINNSAIETTGDSRQRILRIVREAMQELERAERQLDRAFMTLAQAEHVVERAPPATFARIWTRSRNARAEPATEFQARWLFNGKLSVAFDGGKLVELPSTLARLSLLLADSTADGDDDLVGRKTLGFLCAKLQGQRTKKALQRATLVDCVYDLRERLELHGYLRGLVQYDPIKGYSLALWKPRLGMSSGAGTLLP